MKRRRTPQDKKALAYRKDHIVPAEYPNAFHRNWPRKRAKANRAYRHQVRQLLQSVREAPNIEDDQAADVRVKAARRRVVRHWGAISLGHRVADRQQVRVDRTAWNFFKTPYASDERRQRFAAFLAALTQQTASPQARGTAQLFAGLLQAAANPAHEHAIFCGMERRQRWLQAFLHDEPAWEPRLRAWISRVLH